MRSPDELALTLAVVRSVGDSPRRLRSPAGDIRRLCDLFGLTVGGAERYTRRAEGGL